MATPPKDHPSEHGHTSYTAPKQERDEAEKRLAQEKRKQPGIGFPAASVQKHLLIIRLDLASAEANDRTAVQQGLRDLCELFARLDDGRKKIEVMDEGTLKMRPLSDFQFTTTIGFGIGFFNALGIQGNKRPQKLMEMPDHTGLGDVSPYSLSQTDMILQLGATDDFINRWVLENAVEPVVPDASGKNPISDIVSAIRGWATIVDVHAGFQRVDGRNLQGFNDGVSNPRRLSPLFDEIVWTTLDDETNPDLVDGTYMVFQKIVHDLDQWRALSVEEQEQWVGRSKSTGLLLGTLPPAEDRKLGEDLRSDSEQIRQAALTKWKPLFDLQADPEARFFDHEDGDINGKPVHGEIPNRCPAWSHVRKANPREEDNLENPEVGAKLQRHLIFRRGYPFMESGADNRTRSGLLFVCFQRDIADKFEFIKKNWFNNKAFTVPFFREFNENELAFRRQHGRFKPAELEQVRGNAAARALIGLAKDEDFEAALKEARAVDAQTTGREGLGGPSEHGVIPFGQFLATVTLGGGYYFIPPIPNRNIAEIGQQFFEQSVPAPSEAAREPGAASTNPTS